MNNQHLIRFLHAVPVAYGFGFFSYGRVLSSPEPPNPLRQIFSLARAHQCSFIVEERLPLNQRCSQEIELLRRVSGVDVDREVVRLGFFRTASAELFTGNSLRTAKVNDDTDLRLFQEATDLQCLGYLYLYNDRFNRPWKPEVSHVHAAVMLPPPHVEGKYIHSYAHFQYHVAGRSFSVPGSYFAQQQKGISSCAHVATIVAMRNLSKLLDIECSLSYGDYNRLLNIDHLWRNPSDGLTQPEMVHLLSYAGITSEYLSSEADDKLNEEFVIKAAYYAVETGLPAIICFLGDGGGHAMTVVGHTFDGHRWPGSWQDAYFPSRVRRYLPSHSWVGDLIVQDDNFGPYCTLPINVLAQRKPSVIVPHYPWVSGSARNMPQYVELEAQRILELPEFPNLYTEILNQIGRTDIWAEQLLHELANGRIVLRTLPYTTRQYLKFLQGFGVVEQQDLLEYIEGYLTDKPFWLVEISVPELYQRNNHRIGEVLLRPSVGEGVESPPSTENQGSEHTILLVRLPATMLFLDDDTVHPFPIAGDYHYPIARTWRKNRSAADRAKLYQSFFQCFIPESN